MNKRFIPLLILGATIAFFVIGMMWSDTGEEEKAATVPHVKTQSAGQEEMQQMLNVIGVVKGKDEIALASKMPGRVEKIHVNVGDTVWKGQLLATIDGAEAHAQTAVAAAGAAAAADASAKTEEYFDQIVDEAKSGRESAEDAYESAKDSGDDAMIAQTKAAYEAAKEGVRSTKKMRDLQIEGASGQSAVAGQQLVAAQTYASNTQIRAPFSGVVIAQNFDVGSLVAPEAPLFALARSQEREVDITVPSDVLPYVAVGDRIDLISQDGEKREGIVNAVSPMVNTQTRKALIVISLPEEIGTLPLGTYVDVAVPKSASASALAVPLDALVATYYDTFIFVENDGIVSKRTVETGVIVDGSIEVIDGLSEGEQIVTEGQHNISDGQNVTVYEG